MTLGIHSMLLLLLLSRAVAVAVVRDQCLKYRYRYLYNIIAKTGSPLIALGTQSLDETNGLKSSK